MAANVNIHAATSQRKKVIILGATGTIGKNTLDIISQYPDRFELLGISAHSNTKRVMEIVADFSPHIVAISDEACACELKDILPASSTLLQGESCLIELASTACDMLVHGIVGAAGIAPLHAALTNGNNVALANKESLVCAGHLMMPLLKQHGSTMYPVDSEHNALFQLMAKHKRSDIIRMTLTASGGPFLTRPLQEFANITPAEAVAHPNWKMGTKISIDSATMANKGLELMEAHYLFDAPVEMLDACIHPQSLVHGLLTLRDGSILAHVSPPDMRLPLAYALHAGERPAPACQAFNIATAGTLEFCSIDINRYPMYDLATASMRSGCAAMAAYNAANEIAVKGFLEKKIRFIDIYPVVDATLAKLPSSPLDSLENVLAYNEEIRQLSQRKLEELC